MRRSWAVFFLALAFFTSVASFGFSMTDEAELGAAAYNMYRGRLTVDEVPSEYYQTTGGISFAPRVTFVDGKGYIAESRGAVTLGAAPYALFVVAEPVLSMQALAGLMGTAALAGGAALLVGPRWKLLPAVRRRALGVVAGSTLLLLVTAVLLLSRPAPLDPWGPPIAMQFSMLLVAAGGVAAFHRFVLERSGDSGRAHLAAGLLAAGTSLAFWSGGQKYHAAVLAAGCLVLLLRFGRADPGLARWVAAYVIAGLAIWMHVKAGGLLLLMLLAADGTRFVRRRTRPPAPLRHAAILATALLIGIVPYAVENTLLYGSPLVPGYVGVTVVKEQHEVAPTVADPEPGSPPAAAAEPGLLDRVLAPLDRILPAILMHTVVSGIGDVPRALVEGLVMPVPRFIQYGLFMISPLLVLGPVEIVRRLRARRGDELDMALGVHALLIFLVYALYVVRSGSYDPRYYTPLYPGLVWYASGYLREHLSSDLRRFARAALVVVPAGLAAGLLWVGFGFARSDYWAVLHVGRSFGLAALVVVAGAAVVAAWAARREDVSPELVRRIRLGAWSFGLVPPAWFILQYSFLFPRYAWAGIEDPSFVMFMPTSQLVRDALLRLLGL